MGTNSFIETFYAFGAFQGLFLGTIILIRKRNVANYLLSFMLCLFSFYLIEQTAYLSGNIRSFPHLLYATLPVTFLIGPLFYFYVRLNISRSKEHWWMIVLALLPFLYEVIIMMPFYLLSAERKLAIYDYTLNAEGSRSFDRYWLGYLLYLASTIFFVSKSYLLLKRGKQPNKKALTKMSWLKKISMVFILYLIANVILSITSIFLSDFQINAQHVILIILTLIIHVIGYISFLNADLIIQSEETPKYVNSTLDNAAIDKYGKAILELITSKNVFLKTDLTPKDLCQELGLSGAALSQVISEGLNTNFYRLINEYRVKWAMELLNSKEYENAKIIHVALDSGFNNKTSFLRNFKEVTGVSPSTFKKNGATKLSVPS